MKEYTRVNWFDSSLVAGLGFLRVPQLPAPFSPAVASIANTLTEDEALRADLQSFLYSVSNKVCLFFSLFFPSSYAGKKKKKKKKKHARDMFFFDEILLCFLRIQAAERVAARGIQLVLLGNASTAEQTAQV